MDEAKAKRRHSLPLKRVLSTFSIAYAAHFSLASALKVSRHRPTDARALIKLLRLPAPAPALFPALLPYFHRCLSPSLSETAKSLALSPMLLLLPQKLRVQAAAWTLSWAVVAAIKRWWKGISESGTLGVHERWVSEVATIAVAFVGNAWILWATLFEGAAGAQAYSGLLLRSAPNYAPPRPKALPSDSYYPKPQQMYSAIASVAEQGFPPFPPSQDIQLPLAFDAVKAQYPIADGHQRLMCAFLHPGEVSCFKNAARASLDTWERFLFYLLGYMSLGEVVKRGRRILTDPATSLSHIMKSTVLGTTFLAGSCTTAWSFTCFLQRLLPPTSLTRLRWPINSFFATLWLLLVPSRRRQDLVVYMARSAVLSMWKVGENRGLWKPIRGGEVLLFAMGFSALSWLKQRDGAVGGFGGQLLTWVDGKPEVRQTMRS